MRKSESQVQISQSVGAMIDLATAPAEDVAEVCTQRQFFLYVGNAESLGKVYIPRGFEPYFGMRTTWQAEEWRREWSYFGKVRQQLFSLVNALGRPSDACFRPDVINLIKRSQKLGSVTLMALIDGPNISGLGGAPNANGDSYLQSWHFGFSNVQAPQMGWQVYGPYFWRVNAGQLAPKPINTRAKNEIPKNFESYLAAITPEMTFETIVPEAVDAAIAGREIPGALHFADGRPFTQTHYAFKSHGAQVSSGDIFRTEPDEGGVISQQFSPFSESALLFDSFGPLVGANGKTILGWHEKDSDFIQPLWSSRAICHLNLVGATRRATARDRLNIDDCVKQMDAKVGTSTESPRRPQGAGSPGNDQGAGSPGNDQGAGSPGNDQGAGSPGNDQGAGSPGNDQSASGLTLGAGFWLGATQGSKGFVFRSANAARERELGQEVAIYRQYGLNSDTIRNRDQRSVPYISMVNRDAHSDRVGVFIGTPRNFEPQAFRFLGKGKSLSFRVKEQDRLRFAIGSKLPGVVILDTCYGNLTPGKPSATMSLQKTANSLRPITDKDGSYGVGKALVLSNPMPLLIDAIDYGALNAFQYSFLAMDQGRENGKFATEDVLRKLRGAPKPLAKESEELKSRLLASVADCRLTAETPECRLTRGNWDIMAWDRLYLMSKALAEVGKKANPTGNELVSAQAYYDAGQLLAISFSAGDPMQLALRVIQQALIASMRADRLRLIAVLEVGAEVFASYMQARSPWKKVTAAYFSEVQRRLESNGYEQNLQRIIFSKYAFMLPYLSLTLLADSESSEFAALDNADGFNFNTQTPDEKLAHAQNFLHIWELYRRTLSANPPATDEARRYHQEIAAIAPNAEFLAKVSALIDGQKFDELGKLARTKLQGMLEARSL